MNSLYEFLSKRFDDEKRNSRNNLPNKLLFYAIVLFLLVSICISYLFSVCKYEFISNLFLNLSAGCFTGLVLYMLSTLRSRQLSKTEQVYTLAVRSKELYKSFGFFSLNPMYLSFVREKPNFGKLYADALEILEVFLKTTHDLTKFLNTRVDKEYKEEISTIQEKIRKVRSVYIEYEDEKEIDIKQDENYYKQQLQNLEAAVQDIYYFCADVERRKEYELIFLKNSLF